MSIRLPFEASNLPALLVRQATETAPSVLRAAPGLPPTIASAIDRYGAIVQRARGVESGGVIRAARQHERRERQPRAGHGSGLTLASTTGPRIPSCSACSTTPLRSSAWAQRW